MIFHYFRSVTQLKIYDTPGLDFSFQTETFCLFVRDPHL